MNHTWLRILRSFQGSRVSLSLVDGGRIDDCQLISAGQPGGDTWVFSNGADLFVPFDTITEVWESPLPPVARVA